MIAGCAILFETGLVFFINDDQTELRRRCEDGAARTHDNLYRPTGDLLPVGICTQPRGSAEYIERERETDGATLRGPALDGEWSPARLAEAGLASAAVMSAAATAVAKAPVSNGRPKYSAERRMRAW